jgi:hypothetical protein
MAKITRLAATSITGTNGIGFDFEIKSDVGGLTTSDPNHEITILPAGGITLTQDSGDLFEPFNPIVSSSMNLKFFATHDTQLNDIVTMNRAGEKGTYIKLTMWKNASVKQYWYGVLVPEETTYQITDGRTLVSMRFADGLKMLGSEELRDVDGDIYTGWNTILNYVNAILRKIPWVEDLAHTENLIRETPFLELKDWSDAAGYVTSDIGMLRKTGFIGTTYAGEKENKGDGRVVTFSEAQDCLTVLEDICLNFGYKLAWNGECFHFFSPLNYTDDAQGQVSHDSITYTKLQSGNQQGAVSTFSPEWNADTYSELANGATRVFSNAYNEAIITHECSLGSNIIGPQTGSSVECTVNNQQISTQPNANRSVSGYVIDAGGKLSLRVATTFIQNTQNSSKGWCHFSRVQLKVGDYYLNGEFSLSAADVFTLDGEDRLCQPRDLPEMYWSLNPAYVMIPYQVGYSYMTPSADEHAGGAHFTPSQISYNGSSYYEDDNKARLDMDYTLITPPIPVNSVGIDFEQGSLSMEWNDSLNLMVEWNSFFNGYYNTINLQYYHSTCFLYEGEQTANPIYSTKHSDNVFNEVVDLGKTNLGARLNRNGNNGYISAELEAGGYSFDSQYASQVDLSTGYTNNLQLMTNEWYRMAGTGMEGLDAELMLRHDGPQSFFPWADRIIKTTEVVGGGAAAHFLPSTVSYDISENISFSGVLVDRDGAVILTDGDRPVPDTDIPSPPTIDGRRVAGAGGGGVSPEELQDSKDETDLLAIFISRNNI